MRLAVARLCLDCDEVHEAEQCPTCGSETFAFLTRWVTSADRPASDEYSRPARSRNPPAGASRREQVDAYRRILNPDSESDRPARKSLLARGALGLALLGLVRLAWRARPEAKE